MQRRDAAKALHLDERKVAHSDGAYFPLREQLVHCVRSFFDRYQRVGPMDLIDVDVIGSKFTERVFNFWDDASAAGVAKYSPTIPLKADLGGDYHARAEPAFGNGSANDLFGATESIDRNCVNNIDPTLEGSLDGSDRFRFVGPTPHPAADGPRTDRDGRHSERRAWNFSGFHF